MSRRLALVIGNNDYSKNKLKNCVNDATKLANALENVSYSVTLEKNLTSVEMYNCIKRFVKSIESNDFVIFFFVGHGVQWGDQNFLLPCDNDQIESSDDMQRFAVNAQRTVDQIAAMSPRVVVILLDCCRKYWQPQGRSGDEPAGGLRQMKAPSGTVIAFACASGETTPDRSLDLENGIFTRYLLKHIATPDTDIDVILRRVARDVAKETNNQQKPFRVSSITEEDIYIVPPRCTSSKSDDSDSIRTSVEEKPKAKPGRQKIDTYFKSSENRSDNVHRNNNNQSPIRQNMSDDDERNKRTKSQMSIEEAGGGSDHEKQNKPRPLGRLTRSSATLPKLRETFEDSDDDQNNSRYSSWAKEDVTEYRNNYPHARSDPKIKDNYRFYTNQIPSHPDGDFIDNIHTKWFGNYRTLENHHGYIQWLFPLQERGLNWSAEPLQKHEIELIKKEKEALKRILRSYKLMLDFYGFELVNEKTGELRRLEGDKYRERFYNLNTSSHNYLRITGILKCLGEFDYEYLKFGFLEAVLRECIAEDTLGNCLRSCKDYWIETLRSQQERRAIRQYARELIKYRNDGTQPPRSHRAQRPTPNIEEMSISGKKKRENPNE